MEKYCKTCETTKDVEEFRIRPERGPNAYYYKCFKCERDHKRTPKYKIYKYTSLDKKKGFRTTIDEQWYIDNIQYTPCSYCGVVDESMVADRIDNSKGHLKTNCIPACPLCNSTRGDRLTVDEMKLLGPVMKQIKEAR